MKYYSSFFLYFLYLKHNNSKLRCNIYMLMNFLLFLSISFTFLYYLFNKIKV